jgi:hypothetical protein
MTATLVPTWGHRYWLIWACITFGTFIVPEVYALVTNWRNTLSASVWDMERFRTGQPLYQWSAGAFPVRLHVDRDFRVAEWSLHFRLLALTA